MDWNYLYIDIVGGTMVTILNISKSWCKLYNGERFLFIIVTCSIIIEMVCLGALISMGGRWLLSLI